MAKKIICKPASEIELELDGEGTILLRFDVISIAELQEFEGGFSTLFKKSFPEIAACIVYACGKNHNENFDYDKARFLVSNMSVENINEIIQEFSDAIGIEKNEMIKEQSKNLMAQFLNSMK